MRWMSALAMIWVFGCSVYDDGLIRSGVRARTGTASAATPAAGSNAAAASGGDGSTMAVGSDGSTPRDAGVATASDGGAAASDGGAACVLNSPTDYCAQLPALPRAPLIDGALECGLSLAEMQPLGWKGPNAVPDRRASYAAAWQHDGVYVYIEVHGPAIAAHPANEPLFCGDAVEIYVDADAEGDDAGTYDAMGTMQFVIAAPSATGSMDAWRFIQGNPQGAWISKSLKVTALADGYSVEAFINAADLGLWQWSPTVELGFSIAIDVAADPSAAIASRAGCTAKSGQFFLRLGDPHGSCPGEPWCDARAFCQAALLD
jgi:hypothetical protein